MLSQQIGGASEPVGDKVDVGGYLGAGRRSDRSYGLIGAGSFSMLMSHTESAMRETCVKSESEFLQGEGFLRKVLRLNLSRSDCRCFLLSFLFADDAASQ